MSDTLFENYDAPATEVENGTPGDPNGAAWEAAIFTVGAVGHTVSSVKLLIKRRGTLTGKTLTISIRAVDGSFHPTGSDLCSVSVDPSGYSTSATVIEYTFSSPATLSASTAYAIVVRLDSADASNNVGIFGTASPGSGVSNEKRHFSVNSGSSWTATGSTFEYYVYGIEGYTISVSDNFPMSDSKQIDIGTSVQDTISLSEALTLLRDVPISVVDSMAMIDMLTVTRTGWEFQAKNNASWNSPNKNSSNWTFQDKN